MEPIIITFGKYKGKNVTLQELLFLDFGYCQWLHKKNSNPFDRWSLDVGYLMFIADSKKVVINCCCQGVDQIKCDKPGKFFCIVGTGRWMNIQGSIPVCDSPACLDYCRKNAAGSVSFHEISFHVGFDKLFPEGGWRSQTQPFARKLAEAWGILDKHGRLTRENILNFFSEPKE